MAKEDEEDLDYKFVAKKDIVLSVTKEEIFEGEDDQKEVVGICESRLKHSKVKLTLDCEHAFVI